MKRMLLILFAMIAVAFLAGSASAVEYKWTGDGFVEVNTDPVVPPRRTAVVVPAGHHAHTRIDGTTFIHGDENYGLAAPHAGVERPWPKTGLPGQTVIVDEPLAVTIPKSTDVFAAADCPNGRCPAQVRGTTSTVTQSYSATTSTRSSRTGPIRRLFGAIFRGRGGCR